MNTVSIITPHPDDETLGCGGTILKHGTRNDVLHWIIVTAMTEKQGYPLQAIRQREKEINRVSELYGFTSVHNLHLPTAELDTIPRADIVATLGRLLNEIRPDTLYLPNRSDVHSDHRIVFDAAWSCCKAFRYPFIKRVLMYETLSETDLVSPLAGNAFLPNSFNDISDFLQRKLEIMREYGGEIKDHPFPRSEQNVRALATLRGATAGVDYAEAFVLLKEVQ